LWAASNATVGSLVRSYGLAGSPNGGSALNVCPGRNVGASHVAPPSPERTAPMSVAPPSKNRPTWNVVTTVPWCAKVSGSTSVACMLVALVNGSALILVSGTAADAEAAVASTAAAVSAAAHAGRRRSAGWIVTILVM
jgi:hypothetical protein